MNSTITGFPRIGKNRELKFALEKYFRNEITELELKNTAKELRKSHWKNQYDNSISYIPSNDFSMYDNMLDTALLLNVIPKRFQKPEFSNTDIYFAMARGYQGKYGDAKALAMKKWFNTNYHYMVPEIDKDTQVRLNSNKPFDEFSEAKALGIDTKPVIIGPFTFLKLSRINGDINKHIDDIISAYSEILEKFNLLGAKWVQIDEPYMVFDLSMQDISLIKKLYEKILVHKQNLKVICQTYFGDIRDCYNVICDLDFDGIGIDFIEGKQSLELINKNGFPKNKTLFAGIVSGKNIWRNSYKKSLEIIDRLNSCCDSLVLSTSCSLLHIPYTVSSETSLDPHQKQFFSFALEKLGELSDLCKIIDSPKPSMNPIYIKNANLFSQDRKAADPLVQKQISELKESDFIRLPEFSVRKKIQKQVLDLPLFPTTTIGSFPQTKEIRQLRSSYKSGKTTTEDYKAQIKDKIKNCIAFQENIGLDVLVHGEYERNDMVEYFGQALNGFLFTKMGWVQSYGSRCVKPPIIWGDISRRNPITLYFSLFAQSLTNKPVKGMLTGPVTIFNWSFPREDITAKESTLQIALAIKNEVNDLESNGIKIIQIDEAALREKLPLRVSDRKTEYLDWAIPAFRLVHSSVKPQTQIHTHMCYSEFSNIIKEIDAMDADVITFEASRSDLAILKALKDNNFRTDCGPGVYDIHSPRIPQVVEIKESLNKMLKYISADKLWVNPDCGLKTRNEKETYAALNNLVKAAKEIRNENQ